MKKKQLLSALLALVMLLALLPAAALADEAEIYKVYQGDGYYITAKEYGNQAFTASVWSGTYFSDGLIQANSSDEFLDKDGNVVISSEMLDAISANLTYQSNFSEGLCVFNNRSGDFGYMDKTGKVVVSPVYNSEYAPFHDGLALVHTNQREHRYIDKTGNTVLNAGPSWSYSSFDSGLAVRRNSSSEIIDGMAYDTYDIIDRGGQVQATYRPRSSSGSPAFLSRFLFSEGYGVAFNDTAELHVFDTSGNVVLRLEGTSQNSGYCAEIDNADLSGVHGGILVYSDGRADGINCKAVEIPSGRSIFPDGKAYTYIYDNFSDGVVTFQDDGRGYGLVDSNGVEVVAPEEFDNQARNIFQKNKARLT